MLLTKITQRRFTQGVWVNMVEEQLKEIQVPHRKVKAQTESAHFKSWVWCVCFINTNSKVWPHGFSIESGYFTFGLTLSVYVCAELNAPPKKEKKRKRYYCTSCAAVTQIHSTAGVQNEKWDLTESHNPTLALHQLEAWPYWLNSSHTSFLVWTSLQYHSLLCSLTGYLDFDVSMHKYRKGRNESHARLNK